jgi:hypothetical protein
MSGASAARQRKGNAEGEPGIISRRVKQILRESPTVPQEGGLAKVLFDDQQWYVGRLVAFSEGKWQILFSDGDEDHVGLPDPDVVLLPPINILIQALDEVYEEVKHGLKMILGKDNVSASLSEKTDEIKEAVGMMRRNLKECLNQTTTGQSKEGEDSVEKVRDNFLQRVKARLVFSERILTEDQWKEVVDHAMAMARELDGLDEVPAPAKGKKNAGKGNKESDKSKSNSAAETPRESGKGESGKGAHKGDAGQTPNRNVKFEEQADSEVNAEQDGAEGDSAGDEGKPAKKQGCQPKSLLDREGQADESLSTPVKAEDTQDADADSQTGKSRSSAKRTPKTPKAAAVVEMPESESKAVVGTCRTSARKGRKSQGEAGAQAKTDTEMTDAGMDGQEWKDCPPWLYMNSSIEVQWEGDWWKVIFLACTCLLHVDVVAVTMLSACT